MIDTPDFNQDPKDKPTYLYDPSKDKGPNNNLDLDPVLQRSLDNT